STRTRDPAVTRQHARLGYLRRLVHAVQPQQGRPAGRGTWLVTALHSGSAPGPALAADRCHVRRRPPVGGVPGRAERGLTPRRALDSPGLAAGRDPGWHARDG